MDLGVCEFNLTHFGKKKEKKNTIKPRDCSAQPSGTLGRAADGACQDSMWMMEACEKPELDHVSTVSRTTWHQKWLKSVPSLGKRKSHSTESNPGQGLCETGSAWCHGQPIIAAYRYVLSTRDVPQMRK